MAKKKLSSKSNYVPNRMINEIEVERNGKTTYIDGANVLDGMYVKKGVKFGNGGGTAVSSENGGYTVGTNADFSSNQYQPNTDFALLKRGGMLTWNGESFSAILKDAKENAEESKKEIKKIKGTTYNEDDLHSVAMGVKDDINDIYDLYDEDDSEWVDDDALQICYSVAEKMLASAGKKQKYAKGGGLKSKAKYVPNYMVQSVEVERKGKTTDIDGADIYDGFYVKKGVKFATGGNITSNSFLKKEWTAYTKEARVNALVEAGYSKSVAKDLSLEDWSSLEKKVQNGFRNSLLAEEIEFMKGMMNSIYTYGSLDENSYSYKKYLLPYKETLGKKLFDKIYEEEYENLQGYEIDHNVHTDAEGVTYNSLRKKKALGGFLAGVGVGVAGKWAYDKYGKKLQGKATNKVASKGKKRKYEEGGEISNWGGTAESSQEGMLIGGTNAELTSNQYSKGGMMSTWSYSIGGL